jgi:transcriptional regulator with XRE-family HTH domain
MWRSPENGIEARRPNVGRHRDGWPGGEFALLANHGLQAGVIERKRVSATISATLAVCSPSVPTLSATASMDAEIFKLNLKGLLEARGMSQQELAERCGLGYQWVRRVCSRGLTRVEDRNRDQLQAICELFGISPVERLWSPDLHAGMGEAAWYGAKVEKILNETRSVTDFEGFVDISEDSIIEMVQIIDRLHTALKRNQEKLAQLHEKNLDQRPERGDPFPSRTSNDVEQLRKAMEYSAKLRQVFRNQSHEDSYCVSMAQDSIDILFYKKESRRIASIFRDSHLRMYEAWIAYFEMREEMEDAIALALGTYSADQVRSWLESHSPSGDSDARWDSIREGMAASAGDGVDDLSTHGGNTAESE